MEPNQNKQDKPKKKKTPKCKCILENGKKCKKKLSAVDLCIVCKCGKSFCALHRPAEKHNCKVTEILAVKSKQEELNKVLGGGSFKQLEVI
tara:strand:+ start:81 stop:353 length:273 start_codon:yes stop_codon:yes gene_type:complete